MTNIQKMTNIQVYILLRSLGCCELAFTTQCRGAPVPSRSKKLALLNPRVRPKRSSFPIINREERPNEMTFVNKNNNTIEFRRKMLRTSAPGLIEQLRLTPSPHFHISQPNMEPKKHLCGWPIFMSSSSAVLAPWVNYKCGLVSTNTCC